VIYETSYTAVAVFAFFVAVVLGISFYLGAKAKSASGYYAAHGQIPWFVNGVAFAGDYLSAASFLGICGMIAFYGYDGFLYSIGYLAGWIVALLVIAEPLKRLGKFTFADALDSQFNSRGIKLAAAISTLVVSVFYLIPQMVGAGTLIKPLLGFSHQTGVLVVGVVVVLIVVTAGMVSTTWVQFIKGALLVLFCTILTAMILNRGIKTDPTAGAAADRQHFPLHTFHRRELERKAGDRLIPPAGPWEKKPYLRVQQSPGPEGVKVYRELANAFQPIASEELWAETQTLVEVKSDGATRRFVNGLPHGRQQGEGDFRPVGHVEMLFPSREATGPLGPASYLATLQDAGIVTWANEKIVEGNVTTTVFYPKLVRGNDLLTPGGSPTFAAIRQDLFATKDGQQVFDWKVLWAKLDFLSLMIALFAGTASLPHILIRYYTVKDQASARKSTVVGIASIGFFYVLTLYLGMGAMTSGTLDPTNNNMAAPLLARSFGELPFAVISAIAFTTVLGTVSGLIMAASGAVAHDIMANFLRIEMNDATKVRAGKLTAVVVGIVAMVLGILFEKFNVSFLVGWAFNVAASANLPSLVMLLFWRGTTKQGITAAIFAGLFSSLAWVLASGEAYKNVYGLDPADALVPFSQPGIVTIPLGFAVLVLVSLATRRK
jgi:cation/acetate symporter